MPPREYTSRPMIGAYSGAGKWEIERVLRQNRVGDGHNILPVYCRQGPREIVAKAKAVGSRFGKH